VQPPISNDPYPTEGANGGNSPGQRAAEAIDQKRESVARGMDSAASRLHARAESIPGGERVSGAVHTAAAAVERAADYVRDQDLQGMLEDVQHSVKRHPGVALLTAAALGFLLARTFTRH